LKAKHSYWLACAAGSALLATACASTPPSPLNVENVQTLPATVEAVDPEPRLIQLRTPDGRVAIVEVGPGVPLSRIRPGERVMVRYYQSLAAQLKKKGRSTRAADDGVARSAADDGSARPAVSTLTSTVVIDSVDEVHNTVTFRGSNGKMHTVPIQTPGGREFAAHLRKGDEVEVTLTESFALSVVPAT
jgi:hypothetical protein